MHTQYVHINVKKWQQLPKAQRVQKLAAFKIRRFKARQNIFWARRLHAVLDEYGDDIIVVHMHEQPRGGIA